MNSFIIQGSRDQGDSSFAFLLVATDVLSTSGIDGGVKDIDWTRGTSEKGKNGQLKYGANGGKLKFQRMLKFRGNLKFLRNDGTNDCSTLFQVFELDGCAMIFCNVMNFFSGILKLDRLIDSLCGILNFGNGMRFFKNSAWLPWLQEI